MGLSTDSGVSRDVRFASDNGHQSGHAGCRLSASRDQIALQQMALFDDLVSPSEKRLRHRNAKRLRGREIDDNIKFCRLLYRNVPWRAALKNLLHEFGTVPNRSRPIGAK